MSRPPKPRRLTDAQRERVAGMFDLLRWGADRVRMFAPKMSVEESRSLAGEALCYAVLEHDPARGKLTTCYGWQLRNVMANRKYHRRHRGYRHGQAGCPDVRPIDRPDKDEVAAPAGPDPDLADELAAILAELPAGDGELLRLRFVEGRPLDALGASLGISRQSAGARVAGALARAREAALRRGNL